MTRCLLIVLALLVPPRPLAAEDEYVSVFDEIHATVEAHFYDPDLRGLDWESLGRTYRARAVAADSPEAFSAVVNEMLAQLETSHTRFFTSREPAYYQLLAIFRRAFDDEIRAAHPDNPDLHYDGIGIFTRRDGGDVFVTGVIDGAPADTAGLRVGDRIETVERRPFHPIGSFAGRAGRDTVIVVQRAPDTEERVEVIVRPETIDPGLLFVRAMEKSMRLVERPPYRIGYVHAWSYAGEPYHDLLKQAAAFGVLKDADALVLDLRGGWGGANPEDLSFFNPRVPVMTHLLRDGTRRDIDFQWRKPAVLLVDGGSRSGKEVFAYGFQKHALGPVVGARTAGAVVGGRPFLLRPGMLLYLAVLDVEVDGQRLEGVGVTPDIVVPFDVRYANGTDPQLEAALDAVR